MSNDNGAIGGGAPDLHAAHYRCFTLDHNEDDAARIFQARYGQPPAYIIEDKGILWVGPVPVREDTARP